MSEIQSQEFESSKTPGTIGRVVFEMDDPQDQPALLRAAADWLAANDRFVLRALTYGRGYSNDENWRRDFARLLMFVEAPKEK